MQYQVPKFPSRIGIWRNGNAPPAFPDITTVCQLTPGRRAITPFVGRQAGTVVHANMHVLLPKGTDIRDVKAAGGVDLAEAPVGSGRFYTVRFVDDIGLGFPNEHRFAMLEGIGPWPLPFPMSVPPPGVLASFVGAGGSAGVPAALFNLNVTVPFDGALFVVLASYNNPAFPPLQCQVDGGPVGVPVLSPIIAAAGQTCVVSIFRFGVLAGPHAIAARSLFLTEIQCQVMFSTGISFGTLDNSGGAIGAGVPGLPGPAGQVNAVDLLLSAYGQINAGGPFGYGLGYVSTGNDVTDLIGGVPCTLSLGSLVSPAVGLYPSNMPLAGSVGWTGITAGYY